jgi:hypothetical protein
MWHCEKEHSLVFLRHTLVSCLESRPYENVRLWLRQSFQRFSFSVFRASLCASTGQFLCYSSFDWLRKVPKNIVLSPDWLRQGPEDIVLSPDWMRKDPGDIVLSPD